MRAVAIMVAALIVVSACSAEARGVSRSHARVIGTSVGKAVYIEESVALPAIAYTMSGNTGRAPQTVTFTDASTGTPTTWKWHFGDGDSSSLQNPTHVYATGSACAVRFQATNGGGTTDSTLAAAVDLLDPYAKMVSATVNMSSGKMLAKAMVFPTGTTGTVTVKFFNTSTNIQIGVTKTAVGNPCAVTGVTVTDGVEVRIEYTYDTTTAGYADVTTQTIVATATMANGSGDTPVTPASPE